MEPFLVAIHRSCNLTFSRYRCLKKQFQDDWEHAWKASITEWQQSDIDVRAIQSFFANRENISPTKEIDRLRSCEATIIRYGTPQYPVSLSHIHTPPVLLFCRGEIRPEDFPSISVVGSRKISRYGLRAAESIVGQIADAGITIVSGIAFGADTVAHRIAIEHGTRTIAVLGNGIDVVYPTANQAFAEKFIREGKGAILSEYLPGTEGRAEFFPVRNRIVSGLSRATLILEAAQKSGSLITAELALQQNREVFAVPGDIFSHTSEGCNTLIAKGCAAPALSGEQILDALSLSQVHSKKIAQRALPTTENESLILAVFENNSEWHIDDLLRAVELPHSVVSSTLSILEIKGFLKNLGNHVYSVSL